MRCYLAPDKGLNTEAVIMYIIQQPRRTDLMVSSRLGDIRGEQSGQGDRDVPSYGGPGGHDCSFSPMTQAMVEGHTDMEHDMRGPGGVLSYQLHPGNRPPSVPEHGIPVCMAQHRPLLGS